MFAPVYFGRRYFAAVYFPVGTNATPAGIADYITTAVQHVVGRVHVPYFR